MKRNKKNANKSNVENVFVCVFDLEKDLRSHLSSKNINIVQRLRNELDENDIKLKKKENEKSFR